jgi:hypothetical protein
VSDCIPSAAAAAWQAYNAMEATKQRHFAYLRGLEARYEKYGIPSDAEKRTLERLLKEHDAQVSVFKTAMQELRARDHKAHGDLLDYISQLQAIMAPFAEA